MSHKTSVLFALGLFGCAPQIADRFSPFVVEVTDQIALQNDIQTCHEYAKAYLSGKSTLDASQIAQEGATKGFSDLGYSAVSPFAPALGALGGASGEIVSELGLDSAEAKKIITVCLHDKGQQSNSYHIYDPHL